MRVKRNLNIFEYVDYRLFLRDYYESQKVTQKGFTYRSFAEAAGVSASLLMDIINTRQNLTIKTMQKYAAAMTLTKKETAYFEALVGFTNASANIDKNSHLSEMMRLRGRSTVQFVDIKQYDFFSKWYHPVVREMMTHKGLGDDPEKIADAILPKITIAKVKKSIALLKSLNLVYKDESGIWRASDAVISSEYEIQTVALKQYHTDMLDCAKNALENFESNKREFQGHTLSASRETFARLKERIRAFSDEVLSTAANEKNQVEVVFQLNIQMFPFSKEESIR